MKIQHILEKSGVLEELDIIIEQGSMTPKIKPGRSRRTVTRQFKRYGNKLKRQYRCMSGPRKGRLVANPQTCGKRKDPRQVRAGKKSSRLRRGERVRKTKLTKRRPLSQRLQKFNKRLRGEI